MRVHATWLAAALLVGCSSAPPRPARPRVVVIRPIRTAPSIATEPLEARLERARRSAGDALIAEQHLRPDGEERLHLVFEQGRCYRVWVGADGGLSASLEDEHGHPVATGGPGWLGEVCPRWSGSFALVLAPAVDAREVEVLVAARPR